jgi:rhodanese-related sulfurtransferase
MIASRRLIFVVALAYLGLGGVTHAGTPQDINGAKTLDSKGVIALIEREPKLVIIDVRNEKDFNDGHIEGAIRLLDDVMLREGKGSLEKFAPNPNMAILFYCNGPNCGRAARSAQAAVEWGYKNVHYYYLGIPDWRAQKLPLAK